LAVVKNLMVRSGADFSALYKEMNNAQKRMNSFQKGINKAMKVIGITLGSLAVGKLVKDSTQMAMGVESAVDNVNRNMRSSAGAFQEWVNTQSQALGMAKSDAYSYGSTFSNLLSSFTSSAQETAEQTQELMKAAAIIASKTGRTYEDTANRIRSGMLGSTEAIEDLGVYTNISMIESTEAFRRLAGDKSWSQLSFQTQQQIRLAAILEQTYARYGDTLADTTQTRQAQFIASLKNIQLSLGQAFLPIYNAVLPALTRMAEAIGRVINLVAQFVTALFGAPKQTQAQADATQAQADATGDLGDSITGAGKAAKKASKALAGFDEINKLSSKTDAGKAGTGAAGAGTVSMPSLDTGGFIGATTEVSEKMQKMADKVKEGFERIKNTIMENKPLIIAGLASVGAGIATYLIGTNWTTIVTTVKGAMSAVGGAISGVSAPILLIAALIALLVAAIVDLWQNNEEFRKKVTNAWNGVRSTLENVWNTVLRPIWQSFVKLMVDVYNEGIKPLWSKWVEFVKQVVLLMADLWAGIKPVFDWIVKTFGPGIVELFKGLFNQIKIAVLAVIDIVSSILKAFSGVIDGVRQIFRGLIDFIAGVFTGDWRRAWDGIKSIFSGVKTAISSVWTGIKSTFSTIINYVKSTFKNAWSTAWNSIKTIFSNVFNSLKGIVKAPLNFVIDAVNKVIRGINRFKINIPGWVASLAGVKGGSIGFNIATIPRLAQGGIITSPTIAMVGEAGAEAVMPLERNTGWIDVLAAKLATAMQGVQLAGAGGDIYVYVGNEQVDAYIHRSQDRRNIRSNGR
jgi:hypothetical protein